MTYLEAYKTFKSPEQMKRIVALMHRQAVKAKSEGLFFKVRFPLGFSSFLLPSWEDAADVLGTAVRTAYRPRALQARARRPGRRKGEGRTDGGSSETHRVRSQEVLQGRPGPSFPPPGGALRFPSSVKDERLTKGTETVLLPEDEVATRQDATGRSGPLRRQ
jgi:hypothetical protein